MLKLYYGTTLSRYKNIVMLHDPEKFCGPLENEIRVYVQNIRPPLWSSGKSFWLQIQRSRVRSPALSYFLSSSGSGTGCTQPREVKLRSYLNKKSSGSRFRKQRLTAVGTRCANHVTPLYPHKVGTNFAYRRRPLCRYGSLAD